MDDLSRMSALGQKRTLRPQCSESLGGGLKRSKSGVSSVEGVEMRLRLAGARGRSPPALDPFSPSVDVVLQGRLKRAAMLAISARADRPPVAVVAVSVPALAPAAAARRSSLAGAGPRWVPERDLLRGQQVPGRLVHGLAIQDSGSAGEIQDPLRPACAA